MLWCSLFEAYIIIVQNIGTTEKGLITMRTKCERRKLTFKKRLNRKASFVSREAGSISDCLANYEERGSSVLETPTQKNSLVA